ncbi:Uma2 family endonuclease [Chelatococcus sambhunathii]|uniref:Uma2 family endonuclease n=1 Tax=Chelatococcus sambhunathii TaxID=363953 RepID=A0ABU1DEZ5_9HYPH|nr:Uma2 family endonuclease [Chelatococcus sambhunathii]MDR4306485.1 Uma2 family endonuclease [Chelatococcus sambhunathii]
MNADPALKRATYADLEAVPSHLVAEIVDGRLETHPRPRPRHGGAAIELSYELTGPYRRGRGGPGGWIFIPEPELHLGPDVVVPDLAGWRRERLPTEPETAYIETPPDWVCEILSPATARLDRGPKRRIYAEAGVAFLWLLDPAERQLECFALAAGSWMLKATFQPGDEVRVEPFDAVGFPLDVLFPFDEPAPQKPSEEA